MIVVIKKIKKLMYNLKYIIEIQKQKWEDIIVKKVSMGETKVRNKLHIKRLKKLYWFYFFYRNIIISY